MVTPSTRARDPLRRSSGMETKVTITLTVKLQDLILLFLAVTGLI
ncbi:MAG: hypothetical protein Q8M32_06115 [Brevundimonas sp.]|nr:hypothetical protein [Brevundimonas sp.]